MARVNCSRRWRRGEPPNVEGLYLLKIRGSGLDGYVLGEVVLEDDEFVLNMQGETTQKVLRHFGPIRYASTSSKVRK